MGSTVSESLPSSPGHIRAHDAMTGALKWILHTIPQPGEFGYDTWLPDAYKVSGGANAWAGLTVDHKLGIVYGATGLLYVNANEMAWLLRMVQHDDHSLYNNACASCHRADLKGTPPSFPSLVDIGQRKTREELATIIRQGTGRMPAFGEMLDGGTINELVNFLITGKDVAETAGNNPNYLKYRNDGYNIFLDPDGYPAIKPPWGTLNAIDLNKGELRWTIPFGEYPALAAKGVKNTGTDNYGGPVVTANGLLSLARRRTTRSSTRTTNGPANCSGKRHYPPRGTRRRRCTS